MIIIVDETFGTFCFCFCFVLSLPILAIAYNPIVVQGLPISICYVKRGGIIS